MKSFTVILNHLGDFSMLSLIGNFFVFAATVLVMFGSSAIIWVILTHTEWFNVLSSIWFPIIICMIQGWVVGKIFSSIYMVACYAILQCFYVLDALNHAEAQKFAPQELQEFVATAQKYKTS